MDEMILHNNIVDFNSKINSIIGQKISDIEYVEINYENGKNFYTKFNNVHSIDFSIIIHTNENNTYEILWDGSFYQYGIGINVNSSINYSDAKKWNMKNDNFWKKYLNKEIIGISVLWETITVKDENKKIEKI
jgi:hypothetical protein